MSASSSAPWVALAGVALGFLLGEGSRYARYRWEISRNKKLVRRELQTVLSQIPQKRDILHQAIAHLKQKQCMPMLSVRSVTTGYYSVLEALYPHLRLLERNCLHVIFERLRVVDDQMDGFEESFVRALKDKIIEDPSLTYVGRLEELLESYAVIEYLARSYLAKNPIDVFAIGERK